MHCGHDQVTRAGAGDDIVSNCGRWERSCRIVRERLGGEHGVVGDVEHVDVNGIAKLIADNSLDVALARLDQDLSILQMRDGESVDMGQLKSTYLD